MTSFSFAMSEAKTWKNTAKELAVSLTPYVKQKHTEKLGWLYITDDLASDFQNILNYLRESTGISNWVGSVGMGVCWLDGTGKSGEAFGRTASIAMTSEHPTDSYRILSKLGKSTLEIPQNTRHWMDSSPPPFGVIHGDPMNANISVLIETLAEEMENSNDS